LQVKREGYKRARAKELSVGGEIGFRCFYLWTSRGDIVLPLKVVITTSRLLTAVEAKVPARSLWVCQTISTKDEFADLAPNTNPMLSPVGMAEPPDQLANLCAARTRAFAASTSRFLGGALVSSEVSSLLEAAAISSTAA
jgi:hypothetical protein